MAYDGELKFNTGIDLSGFQAGIDSLGSIADRGLSLLESSFTATFDAIKSAGSGIWDFMSDAVEVGESFDKSMSNTMGLMSSKYAAGTEEYAQALNTLSTKAQDLGASTQFSASQVSDAFGYMALAGWDVEQQVGAIDGVLNLAAASGMDLANASDMVTDYLSAFSMEADQAGYFADLLAYASTNSNTSVEDLGEAYKNCAANMNASGQSVETTTALLSKMADQGEKGSTAGTKLTAIMRDLKNSCVDGAIAVGDTSVAVYDAQGNMRDLGEIMVDVQNATSSMTSEQRDLALGSSFTADSIAGVNLILNAGADSVVDFTQELKNCDGTAKDVADTMNDNLAGDVTSMGSAFEGLQIALSQYLNDDLRTIVQNATGYLSDLRSAFLDGGWTGLGAAIGDTLTKGLDDNRNIVTKYMNIGSHLVEAIAESISENSDFITKAVGALISQGVTSYGDVFAEVYSLGGEIVLGIAQSIAKRSDTLANSLMENLITVFHTITFDGGELFGIGLEIVTSIIDAITQNISELSYLAGTLIVYIVNELRQNAGDLATGAMELVKALADGIQTDILPSLRSVFKGAISDICDYIGSNGDEFTNSAVGIITMLSQGLLDCLDVLLPVTLDLLMAIVDGLMTNLPTIIEGALLIIDGLSQYILENLPLLIDCAVQIILALVNGILENLPILISYIPTLVNSLVDAIITNLPLLLTASVEILTALLNGIVDNASVLFDATITILNTLIDMIIENLPMLIDCAFQIIEELSNGIMDNLDELLDAGLDLLNKLIDTVVENLPLLIDCALQIVTKLAEEIKNNFPKIVEKGRELLQKLVDGLLDAIDKAVEGAKEVVDKIWNTIKDTDWLTLGKNILTGLADGLWEGLSTIGDTISNVASGIVDGFKDFFGIHSPSKLFRDEIGSYLPKGLAVGVDAQMDTTADDINRSLKSMMSEVDVDGVYSQLQGVNYAQMDTTTDVSRSLKLTIPEANVDEIYSQLQGLNYAQSVPDYSNVVQSTYKPTAESSQQNGETQKSFIIENYLFKNSQKLNSFVVNAGVLENARSGGTAI